jgi:hypothetical protein
LSLLGINGDFQQQQQQQKKKKPNQTKNKQPNHQLFLFVLFFTAVEIKQTRGNNTKIFEAQLSLLTNMKCLLNILKRNSNSNSNRGVHSLASIICTNSA